MIKTIIFDIGNVLADFTWKSFFEKKGYTGEKFNRLVKATVENEAWNEYDKGIISDEEIVERFAQSDPEIREDIVNCLSNLEGIVTKNEYAIPWIEELKSKGYQVLCLSNFSKKAETECADALDFLPHLDGGILSYKEKVIKPMPEIYQLLIERYQLIPEECVFLDDLERNLNGAKAFGIHTIQFINQAQAVEELKKLGVE